MKERLIPSEIHLVKPDDMALYRKCDLVIQDEINDAVNMAIMMKEYVDMYHEDHCVGASANQFGITKRVIIAWINFQWEIIINPVMIRHGNATQREKERCISFPGKVKEVKRWQKVKIKYHNGVETIERNFKHMKARIIQHEMDHLDGKICME